MPRANRQRHAFSLLELIVVVVLLGMLALLGLVSLRGYLDSTLLARSLYSIAHADAKERSASRQSPVAGRLEFDKTKLQVVCRNSKNRMMLGNHIERIEVITPSNQDATQRSISISQSGQSSSYAVGIQSRRGATRWLVVIGMTGQTIECQNKEQARDWMRLAR